MGITFIPPTSNQADNIRIKDVDNHFESGTVEGALKELAENGGSGSSADIIDNLTSTDKNKALSANQGKVLNEQYQHIVTDTNNKFCEVDSELETKASKNEVFSMSNMGQDVKEAMTGGSVAVVGKDSILTENIVDNQVTPTKTSFFDISHNMFNKETITRGKVIGSDGVVVDNATFIHTDFIEVDRTTPIYMTNVKYNLTNGFNNIAEYDADKIFIKRSVLATTANQFSAFSVNTKYVRFNAEIKYYDGFNLMVNQYGTDLLPYKPFGNFIDTKYLRNETDSSTVNSLIDDKLVAYEDTVNSLIDDKLVTYENKKYIIDTLIPSNSYNAKNDILLRNTLVGTTHLDIYNDLDSLCNEYSDYISKTVLGLDSSASRNVNMYRLKPNTFSGTYPMLPKLIISFCIHGSEKPALLSMLNIVNNLCKNYHDDEILKFIRHNLDIVLIPVANPSGYDKNGRTNYNNVDINRNFDYKWDTQVSDEKGESPASEVETQYLTSILNDNKDAICFLDYHTYGTTQDLWSTRTKFQCSDNSDKKRWTIVGSHTIKNCTSNAHKNYDVDVKSGYLGLMGLSNTNNALSINYAENVLGIPSHSPEACYNFLGGENYTDGVNRFNIEYILNSIMESVRVFI